MESYSQLHPKNPYYRKPLNPTQLSTKHPILQAFLIRNPSTGHVRFDWSSAEGLRALTKVLLQEDFQIEWQASPGYLCPPLPNRLNYLCWLNDLIESSQALWPGHMPVHIVDIGTGANSIYPLLGTRLFNWLFTGSDINIQALQAADQNIAANSDLSERIQLCLVPPSDSLQHLLATYLPASTSADDDSAIHSLTKNDELQSNTSSKGGSLSDMMTELLPHRGPIRSAFGNMSPLHQSRLLDCEHNMSNKRRIDDEDRDRRKKSRNNSDETAHVSSVGSSRDGESNNNITYTPIISAVMCNPPFYDLNEQITSMQEEGDLAGHNVEMRTIGGEVAFVASFIVDSLVLRGSVLWYTAMLGKKSSLPILKKLLEREGVPNEHIISTVFMQGSTYRWALAWTFSRPAALLYRSYAMLFVPTPTTIFKQHKGEAHYEHRFQCSSSTFVSTQLSEEVIPPPPLSLVSADRSSLNLLYSSYLRLKSTLIGLEEHLKQQNYYHNIVNTAQSSDLSFLTVHGSINTKPWEISITLSDDIHTENGDYKESMKVTCSVYANYQVLKNTYASNNNNSTSDKRLLMTIESGISIDNDSSNLSTSIHCYEVHCSEVLARSKECIESEFLRSNRRWRRILQRNGTTT